MFIPPVYAHSLKGDLPPALSISTQSLPGAQDIQQLELLPHKELLVS